MNSFNFYIHEFRDLKSDKLIAVFAYINILIILTFERPSFPVKGTLNENFFKPPDFDSVKS